MGPFYSLYRHTQSGHYIACMFDAADPAGESLEPQYPGQRVPAIVCKALIRQYGGAFRVQ